MKKTFSSKFLEVSLVDWNNTEDWKWKPKGEILTMGMTPKCTQCGRSRDRSGDDYEFDDAKEDN